MISPRLVPLILTLVVAVGVGAGACSGGSNAKRALPSSSTTTSSATTAGSDANVATTAAATCTTSTTPAKAGGSGDAATAGDIPDTQAFVRYQPATGGYSIETPEGWARVERAGGVEFSDKLNKIDVQTRLTSTPATVDSVRNNELPTIATSATCYQPGDVTTATRKAGTLVRATYRVNSPADLVTGRSARTDVERYSYWHNGLEAVVTLTSPVGADNVDPWRRVTDSFAWL
jgi:hypothetical protein